MYEIIAAFRKSTRNKMLWVADVRGVEFRFYIPNWRIPEPTPKRILIRIYSLNEELNDKKFITEINTKSNPQLKHSKIYSDVQKIKEHTKTIRFDPLGDPSNWEIGSPYIPKSIFGNNDDEELTIIVDWLDVKKASMNENDNLDKKGVTRKLIEDFEIKIRTFLKDQLYSFYGDEWWSRGVPQNIRDMAENSKKNKEKAEPRRTFNNINFLTLMNYSNIIMYKKNWKEIFMQFFNKKSIIDVFFEKISNIRNDLAHHRFNEADFDKCKSYIDDILKLLPEKLSERDNGEISNIDLSKRKQGEELVNQMTWNKALIPDIRRELFGWYYQLHRRMKINPDDKEDIERHIGGFMETYVILKRSQGLWNSKEWDKRCKYSHQTHLWKLVIDDLDEEEKKKEIDP